MADIFDFTPKLLPAHRDLAWNISATLNDERPVLAIVELKIRSGLNLLQPGALSNNLLRKALEYCSSLPETRVHCGQIRDQASSVIILVELPSARAWQDFQASAALDPLIATFESNPTCHCLLWTTPQSFQISGTVELFTVHLGTATETLISNRCRQFDQAWAEFTRDIAATGNQNAHGNWVEPYCMVNSFFDTPPGRRAAIFAACDAQPATFLGIVCGEAANTDASHIAVTEVVQKFEGSVSKRILVLEPGLEQSQDIYTTHTSPAPLASPLTLFEPVKPVFRRNNGMSLSGMDETWRHNYYAARRTKAGGFPEPRGGYHPSGTINQYSHPPYLNDDHVVDPSLPMVDTLRMTFRAGVLDASNDQAEEFSERFGRFRQGIEALDYCEAVHWTRRHEAANVVVLFIVWRSRENRPEDLMAACNPFLQMFDILSYLERGPIQQHGFTISTSDLISWPMDKHLELITFCTPDNSEAKRLLQIHSRRYFDTALVRNVVAGRGSAGQCTHSGYAHKRPEQGEHATIVSLWSWRSWEARQHWYSQFHAIVQNNYERLGHIVDGVRLVATGGIDFELLDLQLSIPNQYQ